MKMSLGSVLASFGGCLALAAIGGCGSSGTTTTGGTSVDTACADVAAARCAEASTCTLADGQSGLGFNILSNYGSLATCLARQTLNCKNALAAPQTGNSPALLEMCVPMLEAESCTAFFDNMPPASCTPTGPRTDGAPCTFNGQCMSGSCTGTKTSLCGTCGEAPAAGGDCSDTTCADGDRCLAASSTCAAIVALNGPCDATHPCDRNFSCVGENAKTNTSGTCVAAATGVGAPCGGTTSGCDPTRGLYCGGPASAKTCQRIIYPGYNGSVGADGGATALDGGVPDAGSVSVPATPAGTPCGLLADGSRVGCVAGDCYTATGLATGADEGTCKPFAADTAACDTAVGPGCMTPARCVVSGGGDGGTAGTCVIPVGTACPSS